MAHRRSTARFTLKNTESVDWRKINAFVVSTNTYYHLCQSFALLVSQQIILLSLFFVDHFGECRFDRDRARNSHFDGNAFCITIYNRYPLRIRGLRPDAHCKLSYFHFNRTESDRLC